MVKIIYVEHTGARHEVNVPDGENLMEGAVQNNVPGIDGDCGGNAACATCGPDRFQVDGIRAEPPGADGIADIHLERAAGLAADRKARRQHGHQPIRQANPCVQRRCVQAHQVTVGFPGRHLGVDLVDCGLKLGAQGCVGDRAVDQNRPAGAHRRAFERQSRVSKSDNDVAVVVELVDTLA